MDTSIVLYSIIHHIIKASYISYIIYRNKIGIDIVKEGINEYIKRKDRNLRAIAQTLKLAKNLTDNGFGMFRNFLKYKLEDRAKQFRKIDKWYPSSKTCKQ